VRKAFYADLQPSKKKKRKKVKCRGDTVSKSSWSQCMIIYINFIRLIWYHYNETPLMLDYYRNSIYFITYYLFSFKYKWGGDIIVWLHVIYKNWKIMNSLFNTVEHDCWKKKLKWKCKTFIFKWTRFTIRGNFIYSIYIDSIGRRNEDIEANHLNCPVINRDEIIVKANAEYQTRHRDRNERRLWPYFLRYLQLKT